MASSSTGPRYARRFMILALLILLAIIAYSAGWYWMAQQVDMRAANAIASLNQGGREAECANRSVRGYPFRLGLYCDEVAYADPVQGVAFTAGEFRSAAQIYEPRFVVGELDAPARLEAPGLPPLELDWEIMRASLRLTSALPERVSVEGRDVRVAASGADERPLVTLEHGEAHMRPNGADLDLALRFEGLELDPALVQERKVPPLSGDADVALEDGVALAASDEISLRGRSGTIRNARLAAGEASISLSGPFAVDAQGLVDAEFQLEVQNPQELSAVLASALPELAEQIEAVAEALAALGDKPSLPLTISKGRMSIAFLDLGQLPPL